MLGIHFRALPTMTDLAAHQESEDVCKPYDQFILFGDSITQMSCNQALGFAFAAELQEGEMIVHGNPLRSLVF